MLVACWLRDFYCFVSFTYSYYWTLAVDYTIVLTPGYEGTAGGVALVKSGPQEVEVLRRVDHLRGLRGPLQDLGPTPDLPSDVGLAGNRLRRRGRYFVYNISPILE